MSREYAKIACKIPKSVIRCGPRRMLQHICEKCGTDKPFKTKSGKTITIPAGEYQVTDKELMKVFGTDRRQTIIDWRQTILATCNGAVTVTKKHKNRMRWPVNIYHIDIEKLGKLNNEFGDFNNEIVADFNNGNRCPDLNSTTKSAALLGVLRTGLDSPCKQTALVQPGAELSDLSDESATTAPATLSKLTAEQAHLKSQAIHDLIVRVFEYREAVDPEIVSRFMSAQAFHWDNDSLEVLAKVLKRKDWKQSIQSQDDLAFRMESKGDHSLFAQFQRGWASHERAAAFAAERYKAEEEPVEKSYLNGKFDLEEV